MASDRLSSDQSRSALLVGCAAALTVAAAITWTLYDTFWYPPDDGAYAHVAERMLAGDVLNREVQDVHAGYINFANAAAFRLFGVDLRSLRIPLAALNVAQALLVFLLLRRSGALLAFAAAVAISSLSFVQFLNPTAHWYCLFLVLLIPYVLLKIPQTSAGRVLLVGVIVGTIAMFRQLTGAIVAIAVWGWLMLEAQGDQSRDILPRSVLFALAALVVGYVLKQADAGSAVLFGLFPAGLLVVAARRTRASTTTAFRDAGLFLAGILTAALPLLVFHLSQGSTSIWLADTVFAAFQIPKLAFIESQSFAQLAAEVIPQAITWQRPLAAANAFLWLLLILMPAINGWLLYRRLADPTWQVAPRDCIGWLAVFYSLVALHYQIPIYLFYVAGLNTIALAASVGQGNARIRALATSLLIAVSGVALYSHAGQSLSRGWNELLTGERSGRLVACGLRRCGLRIDERDAATYRAVAHRIAKLSSESECILALPSDAALYFITRRCNPTRFFNSALGLRTEADVERLFSELRAHPPAVLIYRPTDKYNTHLTQRLVAQMADLYDARETIGAFEVHSALRDVEVVPE